MILTDRTFYVLLFRFMVLTKDGIEDCKFNFQELFEKIQSLKSAINKTIFDYSLTGKIDKEILK